MAMVVHCVLLEAAAWWQLYYYGNTWTTLIVSGLLFAAGQVQLGWLQHDLLHGSVFKSSKFNRFFHDINLGLLQVWLKNSRISYSPLYLSLLYFSLAGSAHKLVGWKTLSASCKTQCGIR